MDNIYSFGIPIAETDSATSNSMKWTYNDLEPKALASFSTWGASSEMNLWSHEDLTPPIIEVHNRLGKLLSDRSPIGIYPASKLEEEYRRKVKKQEFSIPIAAGFLNGNTREESLDLISDNIYQNMVTLRDQMGVDIYINSLNIPYAHANPTTIIFRVEILTLGDIANNIYIDSETGKIVHGNQGDENEDT